VLCYVMIWESFGFVLHFVLDGMPSVLSGVGHVVGTVFEFWFGSDLGSVWSV